MRFSLSVIVFLAATVSIVYGQNRYINIDGRMNVITTAVPFLTITPDSRSGALGDCGVALDPDANSIHWNPAKLAYMKDPFGVSLSYTPWLKNLVPDINLNYLSGYYKIDDMSGFAGSLKYFTLGDIQFTDMNNQNLGNYSPNEFSVDGAYARKLSENFSVGVALRFIYSNLTGGVQLSGAASRPGLAFAGDISWYYRKRDVNIGGTQADWSLGMNISNIGNKISYVKNTQGDFIPTNFRFGGMLNFHLDEYNSLAIVADLNKLMVPTLPIVSDSISSSGKPVIQYGRSSDVGPVQGMVQSFYDAPGGFKEELREIDPSIGLEYWYAKTFAVRAGYFYEHPTKGNRQYLTCGFGLKYNIFALDFSYLIDARIKSIGTSPLANTIRFSLKFNFGQNK
ncbi:type IX secretion system outer membrane channel protein PorV [bacterium]|nr:type IX secretion system outer membrane channel protein PorV [bacterium]